jgi:uncharacterized membrane protein YgcG
MNTNLKYLQRAALVILACQALTACMTTSVKQAQVINPDAPAGLPALDGYDGKAAVAAMSNYDRSMTRFPAGGTGTGSGGYGGFGGSGYGGSGMSGSFSR